MIIRYEACWEDKKVRTAALSCTRDECYIVFFSGTLEVPFDDLQRYGLSEACRVASTAGKGRERIEGPFTKGKAIQILKSWAMGHKKQLKYHQGVDITPSGREVEPPNLQNLHFRRGDDPGR